MRALFVTAGLLALAGTAAAAAAATSQPQTVRRNPGGPIDAMAQDGNLLGWLAGSAGKCNAVHILTPHGSETIPQPAAGSMTCHWDLTDGRPQLALAAQAQSALWTLPESGSSPSDYVMTAHEGGGEVQLDRVAHASDGTGWWLGAVAGAGKTLAYSEVDVEYVDKLGCLSGQSCKRKIAGGEIKIVTNGTATTLPNSGPAFELAASNGRLAYVAATSVKGGAPSVNGAGAVEIVDAHSGDSIANVETRGAPLAVALTPRLVVVLSRRDRKDRINWYDAASGNRLGGVAVSAFTLPQLAASNRTIVYRVGRVLHSIAVPGGRLRKLAQIAKTSLALSLAHNRLAWAENRSSGGVIRALRLG